jgi:hypothetical protein
MTAKENREETTSFDARIVLRPRSLDETMDLALRYARLSLGPFIRVSLLLTAIGMAALIGLSMLWPMSFFQRMGIAFLLSPILERAVTVYERRHLFRNEPRLWPAIKTALARLPFSLVVSAVISAPWLPMLFTDFKEPMWIAAACMFGAFWPFVLASHVYIGEVAYLEQLPTGRAGQRTRALITFRFARALGLVLMSAIMRALIALGVELTTDFVLGFLLQFQDVADSIGGWPALAGYFLAGPYIALVRLFDYIDSRTRREGWDIQVRFNAIAQKHEEQEARRLAA